MNMDWFVNFFAKRWVGHWNNHQIEVHQRTGHQYILVINNEKVDTDTSLINMGDRYLKGVIRHDGTDHVVKAKAHQGVFLESVFVTVDDVELPMAKA